VALPFSHLLYGKAVVRRPCSCPPFSSVNGEVFISSFFWLAFLFALSPLKLGSSDFCVLSIRACMKRILDTHRPLNFKVAVWPILLFLVATPRHRTFFGVEGGVFSFWYVFRRTGAVPASGSYYHPGLLAVGSEFFS